MVVITGILELHTDDVLEAYFEKNYGPLEKVDVQLPDSKAMLTFKNRRGVCDSAIDRAQSYCI